MLTAAAAVMDPAELIERLAPRRLYVSGTDFSVPLRTSGYIQQLLPGDRVAFVRGGHIVANDLGSSLFTVTGVNPLTLHRSPLGSVHADDVIIHANHVQIDRGVARAFGVTGR
jgi:hypothetical protein